MSQSAHDINNRGKILQFIADKYPQLESIMLLAQFWSYQAPIIKVSRIALEDTLFGPVTVKNVLKSNQLLSVVAEVKRRWNTASSNDLMVFKRFDMTGSDIYVGLKPESCPQLTPFMYLSARNHRFFGRFLVSACIPSKYLTFPESVEDAQPPYDLTSCNPPLITTILECVDNRLQKPEWDNNLMIKLAVNNDLMSIFSFNDTQRFGEGSVLHPYKNDSSYDDNITITAVNGHQYHLDFVHDAEANKLSIYEFMFGVQEWSAWEIQIFMNDREVSSWRRVLNHPMECNKVGLLNDPGAIDTISIGNCLDCRMIHFESESCEDLPIINGHYIFFCIQQLITRNRLLRGFKFNQYPLKISSVFIKCSKQRNGSNFIPFPSFWKIFREEFPSINLNRNWFAPNMVIHGLMVYIPKYVATTFPESLNSHLEQERSDYKKEIEQINIYQEIESKIQWAPNNNDNYQIYSRIEKTQTELLREYSLGEVVNSGKLNDNELNDLPICKIPLIMAQINGETCDDVFNDINMYQQKEKAFNLNELESGNNISCTSNNEEQDDDFIMDNNSDEKFNDKISYHFKQIGLNNIEERAKKYGLLLK